MAAYPHLTFASAWTLSPKTLIELGECRAFIEAIWNTPLRKAHHDRLCKVALIRGAVATTAIEGNTLTEEDVEQIVEGASRVPPSREYQEIEVRNIIDAMNDLLKSVVVGGKDALLSPELLLEFHERVGKELGDHFDAIPGQFRTDDRVVGGYKCPAPGDVPALVESFCDWMLRDFGYASGKQTVIDAAIQAIVAHAYIEWIHPFGDGNGRTGRLVEFYILLRAGYPDVGAHVLSNHYNLTRPEYYRQLAKAGRERDLTDFLAYAVEGLRDGLRDTLHWFQQSAFETAWLRYIYDQFAELDYRKKAVFKRRRELALNFPLDEHMTVEELAVLTPGLAKQYATKDESALVRDLGILQQLGLVVKDERTYRANTNALRPRMARRRPEHVEPIGGRG